MPVTVGTAEGGADGLPPGEVGGPEAAAQAATRRVRQATRGRRLGFDMAARTLQAGVELLPAWARQMHGLSAPVLTRPLVRAGTMGLAKTLRWTFAGVRAADAQ